MNMTMNSMHYAPQPVMVSTAPMQQQQPPPPPQHSQHNGLPMYTPPEPPTYTPDYGSYTGSFSCLPDADNYDIDTAAQITMLLQGTVPGTLETDSVSCLDSCIELEHSCIELAARNVGNTEVEVEDHPFEKEQTLSSHHDTGYISYQEKEVSEEEVVQDVSSPVSAATQTAESNSPWRLSVKLLNALHKYACTGDVLCLLLAQRYLVAVQDDEGDK